jgi:hypothetical protein
MKPMRHDLRTWLYPPLLGPGILLAAVTWPLYGTGVLFVLAALISGISHRSVVEAHADRAPVRTNDGQHSGASPARTLDVAVLGGLIAVSLAALAQFSVPLTLVVAAGLVAGSSWGRRWTHTLSQRLSPSRGAVAGAETAPPLTVPGTDVARLSNLELCHAWRHSYPALQRSHDHLERARLVAWRQILLDEIEKRDSEALRKWLNADAQPSNSPESFLRAPGPPE